VWLDAKNINGIVVANLILQVGIYTFLPDLLNRAPPSGSPSPQNALTLENKPLPALEGCGVIPIPTVPLPPAIPAPPPAPPAQRRWHDRWNEHRFHRASIHQGGRSTEPPMGAWLEPVITPTTYPSMRMSH